MCIRDRAGFLLPYPVRRLCCLACFMEFAAFGLRATLARSCSGVLVLKPQAAGSAGSLSFGIRRSVCPGIRRLWFLEIPLIWFLSDGVSLLSHLGPSWPEVPYSCFSSFFLSSGRVVIIAYSSVFCGKWSTNGMVVFPKNKRPSPEPEWVT